jgi:hypothetical protein
MTNGRESLTDEQLSLQDLERIQLRMESGYILETSFGFCMGWILTVLVLDAPEQIIPSLAMLGIAYVGGLSWYSLLLSRRRMSFGQEMKDIDEVQYREQGELTIAIA